AVGLPNGFQLVDDDLHQQTLARQDRAQPFDGLQQFRELVENLLPFQACEALQLHVENGLRLDLREPELCDQAVARLRRRLRSANQLDHRVELIERDFQAL